MQTACKELQDEFQDNIYDKYEPAISAAITQSINTALHWGEKVNREDRPAGGYHYVSLLSTNCHRSAFVLIYGHIGHL